MSGFFKVERDFLDSDFWLSEPFTKPQAWLDLFGMANHCHGFFVKRGINIPLERGQTGRSELTFSHRWKWSRNKVRRFFSYLQNNGMITLKQDNKTTIITICNYEAYQGRKVFDDTPNDTPNDTPERHQKDTRRNTNKKKENVKNEKNKYNEDSLEMKISKWFYSVLLKSDQKTKVPNWQSWCNDFDAIMRIDNRSSEDIKKVIIWAHDPKNSTGKFSWIPNLRSPKKVREHFTKILINTGNGKLIDDGSEKARLKAERTAKLLEENEKR